MLVPLGLGGGHADGEMRHKEVLHLCILALLGLTGPTASLLLQQLVFFHRWTELSHLVLDETPGTWGQSFGFVPINLVIIDHILLCMGPRNAFLMTFQRPMTLGESHFHQQQK